MSRNPNSRLITEQRSRRNQVIIEGTKIVAEGPDLQSEYVDLGQVLTRVAATAPEGIRSTYGVGDRSPVKKGDISGQKERA